VWAEAVLGSDGAPTAAVRTPLYPRAVLAGDGAPGLLQGSSLGAPLPAEPGGQATLSSLDVVDTGVPSVVELASGELSIDRGAAPADGSGGGVAAAVDLVTLVGTGGGSETPPSGPQVRVDLVGGGVELTTGTVLGPLGPAVDGAAVVAADDSWLAVPAATSGPVAVDVAGAFAAVGVADPGDGLAVSVTRVVTGVDGSVVVAPGVVADRSWLASAGSAVPATTGGGSVVTEASSGTPVAAIAVGVVLGAVLVLAAMVLADRRHRRRHPGPEEVPPATAPVPPAESSAISEPSVPSTSVTFSRPFLATSTDPDSDHFSGHFSDPGPDPDPDPDLESVAGPPVFEARSPRAEPVPPEPAGPAVGELDEAIDELTERLRRLRGDD